MAEDSAEKEAQRRKAVQAEIATWLAGGVKEVVAEDSAGGAVREGDSRGAGAEMRAGDSEGAGGAASGAAAGGAKEELPPVLRLPAELLEVIARKLRDAEDGLAFAMTCRGFRDVVKGAERTWEAEWKKKGKPAPPFLVTGPWALCSSGSRMAWADDASSGGGGVPAAAEPTGLQARVGEAALDVVTRARGRALDRVDVRLGGAGRAPGDADAPPRERVPVG